MALIYRKKIAPDAFLALGAIFLGGAIRFLQECNCQSSHNDAHHRHQFDEDVKRRTRGVFERVANRVANDRWPCGSRCLCRRSCLPSIIFLALSHAPPELDMNTASVKPAASPPVRSPSTPATPKTRPTTIGMTMASSDGIIISTLSAARTDLHTAAVVGGCLAFKYALDSHGTADAPPEPLTLQHVQRHPS